MASPKAKDEKKARASPSHPSYFQMIKEALMALKERGGSSSRAIAKHVEEGNYKSALPAHFRRMLKLKLKKAVARGRLLKVKGSYKLSRSEQNLAEVKKTAATGTGKKPAAASEAKPAKSTKAGAKTSKKVAPAKSKGKASASARRRVPTS